MAFDLAQFFGMGKKSPDLSGVMKAPLPPQLTAFPTGAALNEQILAGLRGQGIGFDPSFVSRTTSPVIAQRESRFQEQELPFIGSQLSSRGLGRSTIGSQQTGEAFAQKERDINQTLAQAYLADQQQRELESQQFRNLGLQFAGGEAGIGAARATEQVRRQEMGFREAQARQAEDKQTQGQILQGIGGAAPGIGAGLGALLAPVTGGLSAAVLPALGSAIGAGIGGFGGAGQQGGTQADQASPFLGNTQSLQSLLKLLQSGGNSPRSIF